MNMEDEQKQKKFWYEYRWLDGNVFERRLIDPGDGNPITEWEAVRTPEVGDLVLVHGIVAEVVTRTDSWLIYEASAGERIAYSVKSPIEPAPKRIWILEQ